MSYILDWRIYSGFEKIELRFLSNYPYLQGKAMQDKIFSNARLGASRKVCLQILQLLLVLQVMQQRWPFLH